MRSARRTAAVLGLAAVLVATSQPAEAAVGDLGFDVSHPQCREPLPSGGKFGIVGVTNGLPFSVNPCLATQAAWAVGTGEPALYTNTANPWSATDPSPNWPASGSGRCVDAQDEGDAGCAYEYGRKAGAHALAAASSALVDTGLDPRKVTWWLDVEGWRENGREGNSWSDAQHANAADLQGFTDALRQGGVPEVGVYSTGLQWQDITGGYSRSSRSSYWTAWGFPGLYPMEDGPVWLPGATTEEGARANCSVASFTGGQRLLTQYLPAGSDQDHDYRCAHADQLAPTASTTAPTSLVTQGYSFAAGWTGADTGGAGLATFDVRTMRAPSNGGFSAWQLPASLQRTAVRSASLSSTGQGWTTCVSARSRDAAGNVSGWTSSRCTAMPLDDRLLTASGGWSRATASGWYRSTYTATSTRYAKLTRTGLVTSRLHLIAQRCSTCGKVGVYLGSQLLTTVNLYAVNGHRAIIPLPRFNLRTTSVTLKVLTSGKRVRIDGLATSRV